MARIIVLGAGVSGLAAALMLRRDGHDVTVLERDAAPVPDSSEDAWERWDRSGVTQFRQAHYLQPLGRCVLDEELPDVRDALVAAGATRFDPLPLMPPWIPDRGPRPGDERFATITARRPVIEHALARIAQEELDVRRGVEVEHLVSNGVPRIAGVRTSSGEKLPADLVVDAMGRRSRLPAWLADTGARATHEESEGSGFLYYTRFFRGELPLLIGPLLMSIGTFSLLTLPGDGDTWSVTVLGAAGDQPLKRLRKVPAWTAVVEACPLHAHWLEGEPITDVVGMGGIVDRYRRLAAGRPATTGVALLGDACACTNPSLGRGMALGLRHAQLLRDTLHDEEDPVRFAEAWDAATEAELTPWYRNTVQQDRERLREMNALRAGLEPAPPADRQAAVRAVLMRAAMCDADVFRAMLAERCCLGSPAAFDEPELAERVLELTRDAEPAPLAGPDRAELLQLLA